MIDKLKEIKKRYLNVEESLSKPEAILNMKLYTSLNKEYKNLGKIVSEYDNYLLILGGIKEAKEIIGFEKDEEFREIAKVELETLQQKQKKIEKKLKTLLIPKDPNDEKNIIFEIRAGAGGDEAAIFVGDLLRM